MLTTLFLLLCPKYSGWLNHCNKTTDYDGCPSSLPQAYWGLQQNPAEYYGEDQAGMAHRPCISEGQNKCTIRRSDHAVAQQKTDE